MVLIGIEMCYIWITQGGDVKYFINNHLSFLVLYHKDDDTLAYRVVGFEVSPQR